MVSIKRKIILASASPRRARLLRQLGIKFIKYPSGIKEMRNLKRGPAALVKDNALRKAKAVARKFKNGIVIGADTVVIVKSRVIGKPRNYSQAKKMLKLLSRYPHWVYSGIAIVDIDKNRKIADYEKTKIVFRKLAEHQLDKYLSRNMCLDRAGGIDIEGEARKLVKEIKGDFYNVVGLPIEKFKEMLKETI